MRTLLLGIVMLITCGAGAQTNIVRIEAKEIPNRLAFYALNESEKDLDVKLTIKGSNFRQSRAKPRFVRVPASSKVHMKTVVVLRGKKPVYTYDLVVNDSLSNRALRKESTPIKIKPKKNIIVYIPENCSGCDSLSVELANGRYLFTEHNLIERPEIKEQLGRSFANRVNLDSLQTPIVNLGGRLFTKITNYEELLAELQKD
ncbi:hypothetical protein [Poritiphilus flavus]|uniref:Glutaredoxin n=1 Tax=Poritiphilus flavus TaxID=2697053 RepID=A0A6L9EG72_9FLAO|nr:hypothetical protein [Poritiphilus flavus]NAS13249.1 hypothetical protein [Poritiphilus flavus]